ncbi:MAG: GGDEF domain-containing protein [Firmicutes bacterium]|nr:GGDEF domain-containing protein [Bacillota bacterium]
MDFKKSEYLKLSAKLVSGKDQFIQVNRKTDVFIEEQIIESNLHRIFLSTFFLCILGVINLLFFWCSKHKDMNQILFCSVSIMMIVTNIVSLQIAKRMLAKPTSKKRKQLFIWIFYITIILYSISFSYFNTAQLKYLYIFLTYIGFILIPLINIKETFLLFLIPTTLYTIIILSHQLPIRNFIELGLYSVIAMIISQVVYINQKANMKKTNELIILNEALKNQAETDSLTGLYNRYGLKRIAHEKIKENCKLRNSFTVMMIDVDYFKDYNDTYGHPTGDTTLKDISKVLKEASKDCDAVARFGGEEFVIFSSQMKEEEAIILGQKLLNAIRDKKIKSANTKKNPYVTISIGITTASIQCDSDIMTLIEQADEELYYAKEHGRNQLSIHHKLYQ